MKTYNITIVEKFDKPNGVVKCVDKVIFMGKVDTQKLIDFYDHLCGIKIYDYKSKLSGEQVAYIKDIGTTSMYADIDIDSEIFSQMKFRCEVRFL